MDVTVGNPSRSEVARQTIARQNRSAGSTAAKAYRGAQTVKAMADVLQSQKAAGSSEGSCSRSR